MAELTSMVVFDKREITPNIESTIKRELTSKYRAYGSDESREVKCYIDAGDLLYVPRVYGQRYIERRLSHLGIKLEDFRSSGSPLKTKICKVTPREGQEEVIQSMVEHLSRYGDLQMKAATGMGKTVMAISAAIRLGVTTLIVVDQGNLFDQWVTDNLLNKNMFGLPPVRVGRAKAGVIDYIGKDFVVTTVQTLVGSSKVPDEFFDYFGLVIFDEAHTTAGAEGYSRALCDLNAKMRLTITATPRKDVFGQLLEHHVGGVEVELAKKHRESVVRVVENDSVYSWYANTSKMKGRILAEMVEDTKRNALIVDIINKLASTGRTVLVLSDRVKHLQTLMYMTQLSGIADEDLGLYVGHSLEAKIVKSPIEPRTIPNLETGKDYCPVEIDFTKRKVKAAALELIKKTAKIIFATYNIFEKGTDLPKLSAGVDATPRAAAQQSHGRILRETSSAEKLIPVWVTIRDVNNTRLEHLLRCRISEYDKSRGKISLWNLKNDTLLDVQSSDLCSEILDNAERLKRKFIKKDHRNRLTLLSSTDQKKQRRSPHESVTIKTTPRRSQLLQQTESPTPPSTPRRRR